MGSSRFKPQIPGAGVLFPQAARTSFVDLTRSRYEGMVRRLEKKKIKVPFSLEELRADITKVMGGVEDGAIQCRYCGGWFSLGEIALDHALPLSRGGAPNLTNIDYPCKSDNDRKGGLTPDEYRSLLNFLQTEIPLGRQDVLSRLEKAVKLAAGARRAQMLAAQLNGKAPKKAKPQDDDDDDNLGAF